MITLIIVPKERIKIYTKNIKYGYKMFLVKYFLNFKIKFACYILVYRILNYC